MEKLTAAQQKFINDMSQAKKRNLNSDSKTGNALRKKGLAFYALFVGWCVTDEGMKYVKEPS